jgi:hypothetical protein|uniref:Uncharacterized protein n=1 Tax=viral metagenome TaxID=1070528 RepID=A0A6C0IU03_9ZZZZ
MSAPDIIPELSFNSIQPLYQFLQRTDVSSDISHLYIIHASSRKRIDTKRDLTIVLHECTDQCWVMYPGDHEFRRDLLIGDVIKLVQNKPNGIIRLVGDTPIISALNVFQVIDDSAELYMSDITRDTSIAWMGNITRKANRQYLVVTKNTFPQYFTKNWFRNAIFTSLINRSTKIKYPDLPILLLHENVCDSEMIDDIFKHPEIISLCSDTKYNSHVLVDSFLDFLAFEFIGYNDHYDHICTAIQAFGEKYSYFYDDYKCDYNFLLLVLNNRGTLDTLISLCPHKSIEGTCPNTWNIIQEHLIILLAHHYTIPIVDTPMEWLTPKSRRIMANAWLYSGYGGSWDNGRYIGWHPYVHSIAFSGWKRSATLFRIGTYFLTRLLDTRECKRSLPWLLWAWTMPYLGFSWMEPDINPVGFCCINPKYVAQRVQTRWALAKYS